ASVCRCARSRSRSTSAVATAPRKTPISSQITSIVSARIAGVPDGTGEIRRVRVVVHGIVQGVWFRHSTRERAIANDLAGWVRNRADGTVEALFEGAAEPVERLLAFCRTGPLGAHVTQIEVSDEAPEGIAGFEVR